MTPPSVFESLKALDERIFFEKPKTMTKVDRNSSSFSVNEMKLSPTGSSNILTTCVEQSEEQQDSNIDIMVTSASPAPSRKSSLKLRRGNSKRRKNEQNEILNNCKQRPAITSRDKTQEHESLRKSSIQSDKEILLTKAHCIKNDTQNYRSPRVNVRRSLSIKSETHQPVRHEQIKNSLSSKYINNQNYDMMNRKNSINVASIQHYQRRMSTIEQTFEKQSNININNFEDFLQRRMKVDLEKSISSINNTSPSNPEPPQSEMTLEKRSKFMQWLKEITNMDNWTEERDSYSLYIFPETNKFRKLCYWFVNQKWFDNVILLFIALNCITLAMERPNIPPWSKERFFLATANYLFTVVFAIEMLLKVVAAGMFYGNDAYFTSGWNIMDGSLVIISIIDLLMGLLSDGSPRIFGILRVFRLLRSLRPLRVINRAPGLFKNLIQYNKIEELSMQEYEKI